MIGKLTRILKEPFPDRDDLLGIGKDALISGVLVFLVLAVYAPFGLDETGSKLYLYSFIFALVTILSCLLYELTLTFLIGLEREHPSWTFFKWIVMVLGLVIFIAFGNYLVAAYLFEENDFSVVALLRMFYQTFAVALLPVVLIGLLKVNRQTNINTDLASNLSESKSEEVLSSTVKFPIKDSQKYLTLDASKVVFAEAQQNYVLVYSLNDSGALDKISHRNTFSSVLEVLEPLGFLRTHRSFLVNPTMIDKVEGNAQGLKLGLVPDYDGYVPVSRKYVAQIKALFA